MKTSMITIKTNKQVKEEAQKLAEELGLTLSAIVTASLKQFIRTRSVSFSIDHRMTPYLEGVLEEVENDIKAGRNVSPKFSSTEEMDEYLFGK